MTVVPGTASTMPSVLVMLRSARGVTLSVSVAVLFAALISVMPGPSVAVAVFTNVLVPAGVAGFSVPLMT